MIIYKATNKVNGKSYIGKSINPLEVRRNQHIKECKLNRSNSYFHKALLKYGCDQFDWFVIHECGDISTLNDLEISMIKEHNTLTPNGYNLTTGGEGITGYKHTDKTKQKLRHYTTNNNPMNNTNVRHKHQQSIISTTKTKDWIDKHNSGCYNARGYYYVVSPSGDISLIKGITSFCRDNNLNQPKMTSVASGSRRFHKNWKCFYFDNTKRMSSWEQYKNTFLSKNNTISITIPNMNTMYFDSITYMSNIFNIDRSWVYDVIRNDRKPYNGWIIKQCNIDEYIQYMENLFIRLSE